MLLDKREKMKKINTTQIEEEKKARGNRLKSVRLMADLTRFDVEAKYSISASTLQSWESGKCGLTERSAERILSVLEKEGIYCTCEWLLHELGPVPYPTSLSRLTEKSPSPVVAVSDKVAVSEEIRFFRSLHKSALVFRVVDDGMKPHYNVNDHIAGECRTGTRVSHLVGRDCIVQTAQNQLLFRRLLKGSQTERYNLICINIDTTVSPLLLYNQQIVNAAPVIWHRRYDKKV